jgi:hypothetical protein
MLSHVDIHNNYVAMVVFMLITQWMFFYLVCTPMLMPTIVVMTYTKYDMNIL